MQILSNPIDKPIARTLCIGMNVFYAPASI